MSITKKFVQSQIWSFKSSGMVDFRPKKRTKNNVNKQISMPIRIWSKWSYLIIRMKYGEKTNHSVCVLPEMNEIYYKTDEFIQNFSLSFQLISGRNMYMVFITVNMMAMSILCSFLDWIGRERTNGRADRQADECNVICCFGYFDCICAHCDHFVFVY